MKDRYIVCSLFAGTYLPSEVLEKGAQSRLTGRFATTRSSGQHQAVNLALLYRVHAVTVAVVMMILANGILYHQRNDGHNLQYLRFERNYVNRKRRLNPSIWVILSCRGKRANVANYNQLRIPIVCDFIDGVTIVVRL